MKIIPQELLRRFDEHINAKGVSWDLHEYYRKWLRYYLDFCDKYNKDTQNPDCLPDFINKLREKKQSESFQKQAYQSVLLYYDLYGIRPQWLEQQPQPVSVK